MNFPVSGGSYSVNKTNVGFYRSTSEGRLIEICFWDTLELYHDSEGTGVPVSEIVLKAIQLVSLFGTDKLYNAILETPKKHPEFGLFNYWNIDNAILVCWEKNFGNSGVQTN